MVDGKGMQVLQGVINGDHSPDDAFKDRRAKVIAGLTGENKGYTFYLLPSPLTEWQDPRSDIYYTVRSVGEAFYDEGPLYGATHVGYNKATNTIVVWDMFRNVLGEYTGIKMLTLFS